MFKLTDIEKPRPWPVAFTVGGDGFEFTARFIYKPKAEVDELAAQGDQAFLDGVLAGWEGIDDESGEPLPDTAENRARLFGYPAIRKALIKGYFAFRDEVVEGN